MGAIVYNVTVKVDYEIEKDWFLWMKDEHMPRVMSTGCFLDSSILRLKYPADDDGVTYAIQYTCTNMEELDRYHSDHASTLRQEHYDAYGDHVVSFRTILEVVE